MKHAHINCEVPRAGGRITVFRGVDGLENQMPRIDGCLSTSSSCLKVIDIFVALLVVGPQNLHVTSLECKTHQKSWGHSTLINDMGINKDRQGDTRCVALCQDEQEIWQPCVNTTISIRVQSAEQPSNTLCRIRKTFTQVGRRAANRKPDLT